jgi:2-polyprenyl-3-methyl-5-hydroxy-6-metoxy-1,4-benzoquinol methylase
MNLTLVYPRYRHAALEEQYASWQSEMLLRDALQGAKFHPYELHHSLAEAMARVDTEYVLVVSDPLLLPGAGLAKGLLAALEAPGAEAAVPVSNESANASQRQAPAEPYLTLRQFEDAAAAIAQQPPAVEVVEWDAGDPGIFLCRTATVRGREVDPAQALRGRRVAIARNIYVHRWISLRSQNRLDLLELVPLDAKEILEFGCGEALLGQAIKARQKARVVGIELDPEAAKEAAKRIDDVFCGDVREIVGLVKQQFDWIIGGDILEHLDEPWSFLTELRKLSTPGGHLLLSIPNIANWAIVADLLKGRFDYTYIGITCAGHLRFFTRRTIDEMLRIAGWSVVAITPQPPIVNSELAALEQKLQNAGIDYSREDLLAPGWYVVAKSEGRRTAR